MTYTSLESSDQAQYPYSLRIAHLYGNLMNTYGDNGNISSTLRKSLEPMSLLISSLSKTGSILMPTISPFSAADKTTSRPLYLRTYQIKKKTSNASFMTTG
jgi:hypothetical protein